MNVAARFGNNLARLRHDAGLTQADLAARVSMHRPEVSLLERGRRCPRIDTLLKLAWALSLDAAALLEETASVPEPRGDGAPRGPRSPLTHAERPLRGRTLRPSRQLHRDDRLPPGRGAGPALASHRRPRRGRERAQRGSDCQPTKTGKDRIAPLLDPLAADLNALRGLSGDAPQEYIFRLPYREHSVETDWRNYRSRHFVPA